MSYTQPYFNNINPYNQNMGMVNPYQQNMQMNGYQPNLYQQNLSNIMKNQEFNKTFFLQGKLVDSIDVVKSMDIPLDGSISYYPLTDGTAIVTKQLMQDGTSKMIVYKPVSNDNNNSNANNNIENTVINKVEEKTYITEDQFNKSIKQIEDEQTKRFNNLNYKNDIEGLENRVNELSKELEKLQKELNKKGDKK